MTDNARAYRWPIREVCTELGARQVFVKPHCPWQRQLVGVVLPAARAHNRRAASRKWLRQYDVQNGAMFMPMPKRADVDDFFACLEPGQRTHLEALRTLSRTIAPTAREELKWNLPVYVLGENTNLWTLQNFKNHCSLRFSTEFFATQKAMVEAAGESAGAGFVKLPYKRELPIELLTALMRARISYYEQTEAGER